MLPGLRGDGAGAESPPTLWVAVLALFPVAEVFLGELGARVTLATARRAAGHGSERTSSTRFAAPSANTPSALPLTVNLPPSNSAELAPTWTE